MPRLVVCLLACALAHVASTATGAPNQAQGPKAPESDDGANAAFTAPETTRTSTVDDRRLKFLRVDASFRARYELSARSPIPDRLDLESGIALRTNLAAHLDLDPFRAVIEVMDARFYSSINEVTTAFSNPIDLLQAYAGARFDIGDTEATLRGGRMTLDVASRRFVARNRFRNTINAFTGIDFHARDDGGRWQLFATLPVRRRPTSRLRLEENELSPDAQNFSTSFLGLVYVGDPDQYRLQLEGSLFALFEQDTDSRATRNRNLYTFVFRLHREPRMESFDFELEAALQVGQSRATDSANDVQDLDHFAGFAHASVAYTFNVLTRPRILLMYDYASGDGDPDDGANGRFDFLFGANRFELGPTSLYGLFIRSNLQSAGLRLELTYGRLDFFAAYRPMWLARANDAWPATGFRNAPPAKRAFLGHQLEARFRAWVITDNLVFEAGLTNLWLGGFLTDRLLNRVAGNPLYAYTQLGIYL